MNLGYAEYGDTSGDPFLVEGQRLIEPCSAIRTQSASTSWRRSDLDFGHDRSVITRIESIDRTPLTVPDLTASDIELVGDENVIEAFPRRGRVGDDVRVVGSTRLPRTVFGNPVGIPHLPVPDSRIEDASLGTFPSLFEGGFVELVGFGSEIMGISIEGIDRHLALALTVWQDLAVRRFSFGRVEIPAEEELLEVAVSTEGSPSNDAIMQARAQWEAAYNLLVRLHPAHLLTIRNSRAGLVERGYRFPERVFESPALDFPIEVERFYDALQTYIWEAYGDVEKAANPDRDVSLGFTKSRYHQRTASSLHSAIRSLRNRQTKIDELTVGTDTDEEILEEEFDRLRNHAARAIDFIEGYEAELNIERVYDELSVTCRFDDGELTGDIDHLIVTPEAYHVVDYKTGAVSPETVEDKAAHLQKQLAVYAIALHQADGESAVHTTLCFTGLEDECLRGQTTR